MKYLILIALCVFVQAPVKAQDQATPEKEFVLRTKTNMVEVSRGSSGKVDVEIVRSKSYQKPGASIRMGSAVPAGITVRYEPETDVADRSMVLIAVSEQAVPGDYNLILNCTVKNKTKGVILKLKVL
jgi:hypothetical protein